MRDGPSPGGSNSEETPCSSVPPLDSETVASLEQLVDEALKSWNVAPHPPRVSGVAILCYGLSAHTFHLGTAVAPMRKAGLDLTTAMVARQMFECAVKSAWAVKFKDDADRIARMQYHEWKSAEGTLRHLSKLDRQTPALKHVSAQRHLLGEPLSSEQRRYAIGMPQFCEELAGEQSSSLYTEYKYLCQWTHSSPHLRNLYFDIDCPSTLRLRAAPRRDEDFGDRLLWVVARSMVMAGAAWGLASDLPSVSDTFARLGVLLQDMVVSR